jgi:hypothetical protein
MKAQTAAAIPRMRGRKYKLVTLDHLDGRTIAAKRARELIDSITADLGGAELLSEGTRQLIMRAAVIGVFIESCETKWLGGEVVPLNDYLAAVDRQRRVLVTLGLDRRTKVIPAPLEYGRASRS